MKGRSIKFSMVMLLATAIFFFGHPFLMLPVMAQEINCDQMHALMRHGNNLEQKCVQSTPVSSHASASQMWCCVEQQSTDAVTLTSSDAKVFSAPIFLHRHETQADFLVEPFLSSFEFSPFYLLKQREKLRSVVIRD